jgi:CrcB protein
MVYLLIGLAGIVGAILRYDVSLLTKDWTNTVFPIGTLFVNLIGCFIFGYFTTRLSKIIRNPIVATAIGTGFIGSFTTFSSFSVETMSLLKMGHFFTAANYVLASLFGGLSFSWMGYQIGQFIHSKREKRRVI